MDEAREVCEGPAALELALEEEGPVPALPALPAAVGAHPVAAPARRKGSHRASARPALRAGPGAPGAGSSQVKERQAGRRSQARRQRAARRRCGLGSRRASCILGKDHLYSGIGRLGSVSVARSSVPSALHWLACPSRGIWIIF